MAKSLFTNSKNKFVRLVYAPYMRMFHFLCLVWKPHTILLSYSLYLWPDDNKISSFARKLQIWNFEQILFAVGASIPNFAPF